jgi:hypothetical protein
MVPVASALLFAVTESFMKLASHVADIESRGHQDGWFQRRDGVPFLQQSLYGCWGCNILLSASMLWLVCFV